MVYGGLLAGLYALIALSPLITVALLRMKGEMTLMHETGTSVAFAAYGIMALQPVLISRWKWVERPFGLDILAQFHRYMGVFALVLVLCHPPLMAYGGGGTALLTGLAQPWYIWLGRITLALLIAQIVISLFYPWFGLTFEQWRRSHNVLAVLILGGGFVHSWVAGYDMGPIPMRVLWLVFLGITTWAYIDHRIRTPRRTRRTPFRVQEVKQEAHNVWTLKLAPPEGRGIYRYEPGQFHFLTLHRGRGLPVEEHHWTISSSPTEKGFISSTIKESGDFTRTIGQTREGDIAHVQGAFGRFSYTLYPGDRAFVFIAGGIGITPLMSMLRHMRDTGKDAGVLLLYANRTEKDIVFRQELAEMCAGRALRLKTVHILSQPEPGWSGEAGRIDHARLGRLVGEDVDGKAFYVCCPPRMTKIVVKGLRLLGVPYGRIRTERFTL